MVSGKNLVIGAVWQIRLKLVNLKKLTLSDSVAYFNMYNSNQK